MTKIKTIQDSMFAEMQDKSLFEKANSYAMEYLAKAFDRNVYPTEEALKSLVKFEETMPYKSGQAKDILDLLNQYGTPATVTHIGGRYFGFVNGGVVPAGLAAKNLSIFWDQNTAMQVLSPISSKLETVVQNWLNELFGLPKETISGFVSGTSMANFCGLAAARYRILQNQGWDIAEKGLFDAPRIRVVAGSHAHSTILKAISLIGLGKGNVEWVDVDDQGRIKPELIPELDERTILILQAGNVNSGAYDNFEIICEAARAKGAWIHIDGAFGLWAAATDKFKYLTKGIELANSWAVDGHKTLNTPYDSGIILCRDSEALVASLHMTGGYIIIGEERDGMYFTPEMSRRARVIELWATLKYLGRDGINQMVNELHQRANQFGKLLDESAGFQVLNDIVFNQVLVCCETDDITDRTIAKIQEMRECWVGGSTWHGKKVIRISVCSWATTEEDINRSVSSFKKALAAVRKGTAKS
jgi:glutamate/tyrosine decarboxylase-like PLP-dependent enzyme